MDVRVILVAGIAAEGNGGPVAISADSPETFSGVPLSFLPALGQPVLHRIADRLLQAGAESVSVLNAAGPGPSLLEDARRPDFLWKDVDADQVWRLAEEEFNNLAQSGAELVLVMRLGAYSEIEFDPLLQFHFDQRNHVTPVHASDGPLDALVLSASRRNDAAFLLRNRMRRMRIPALPFVTRGYVNRLRTPADLRRLVLDSFGLRTSIQPLGKQIRPGVWLGPGAKVDRSVRLVAPCYIGPSTRVRAGSLITRGSSLEHHCEVDCGTVVEDSTLLPLSYLGAGLDLMHSVLGFSRIVSLKYAAQLDVEDATLVASLPPSPALRTLNHAANLITFVPRQMIRSFLGGRKSRPSKTGTERPQGSFDPGAVCDAVPPDRQPLTPSVAGMRRYGNQ